MPPDLLDERAQVIQGKPRYLSMVSGVELGVAGVCLVGYHSRAQGRAAFWHLTITALPLPVSSSNGMELGRAGIYGALGPMACRCSWSSGDDAFIEETRLLFPQAVYVRMKRATGQGSGISLSPALACSAIRTGVAQAVRRRAAYRSVADRGARAGRDQSQTPRAGRPVCRWPTLARC